jgi:DET1- and DDB1-associated protein 1
MSSPVSSSLGDLLKDLPTHNRDNFSRINTGPDGSFAGQRQHYNTSSGVNGRHRNPLYIPTKDFPEEQLIVTEKTNILLRYLHQQWDKKAAAAAASQQRKRDCEATAVPGSSGAQADGDGASQRKKARLEAIDQGINRVPPPTAPVGASSSSSSLSANGGAWPRPPPPSAAPSNQHPQDPRNGGSGLGSSGYNLQR